MYGNVSSCILALVLAQWLFTYWLCAWSLENVLAFNLQLNQPVLEVVFSAGFHASPVAH